MATSPPPGRRSNGFRWRHGRASAGSTIAVSRAARGVTIATVLSLVALVGYAGEIRGAGLVGNLGQTNDSDFNMGRIDFAQPFTTGSLRNGYTLSSIEMQLRSAGSSHDVRAEIWTSRNDGKPGTRKGSLTLPAALTTGSHYSTFSTSGLELDASTTYLLVMAAEGTSGSFVAIQGTDSDSEDAGSSIGWSIGDTSLQRNRFPQLSPWTNHDASMKIRINGTAKNVGATGKPSVSGTPQVGTAVSASTSGIMDDNGLTSPDFTYQWIRVGNNETAIAGADSATYTPVAADFGKKLRVKVSFTDDDGHDEERTSDVWPASRTILAAPRACPADAHWCTTLTVGRRSGANAALGYLDEDGIGALEDPTIEYAGTTYRISQVRLAPFSSAEEVRIAINRFVARRSVFTLGAQSFVTDAGNERTTAPRRYVWNRPADMAWIEGQRVTMSVEVANSPATGKPEIAGTAQAGRTLTASTSKIDDADGVSGAVYRYEWVRVDGSDETPIPGADASTYTLSADDFGKRVKVSVSFTDDYGVGETVTSEPYPASGTVANAQAPSPATGHSVSADGASLVLVFDEVLGATVPATSAFTVTVDGADAAVQSVSVQDEEVHLAMAGTILEGQTVTASYTDPSPEGATLQDADGNSAASFADLAVANDSAVVTEVSIEAAATSAVYREEDASFTLTRIHSGTVLAVEVTLAQTRSFLPAQALAHTVTFAPAATEATLSIPHSTFQAFAPGEAVDSGTLTATPKADTGHTIDATAGSATVNIVVAATVSFDADGYTVDEADRTVSFDVVVRTGTGAGVPEQTVRYSVSTEPGTATVLEDYIALSSTVGFPPADFAADGTRYRAAKTVVVDIVDDNAWTDDRAFHVVLERAPGLALKYWNPVSADGTACPANRCRTTITIEEDEPAPVPATGKPSISGTPQEGNTLSVSTSDIMDPNGLSAPDFSYQWVRVDGTGNATDIVGAGSATYTPVAGDVGNRLAVKVRFTDDDGFAEEVSSDAWPASGAIVAAPRACPPDVQWCTTLTVGEATDGTAVSHGYASASGLGALGDTTIEFDGTIHAISAIRLVTTSGGAEVEMAIDAFVPRRTVFTLGGETFTARGMHEETSGTTRYVWPAPSGMTWVEGQKVTVSARFPNWRSTGKPSISGTAQVRQTLSASTSGIMDPNGLSNPGFTYQWVRLDSDGTSNATDIAGATSATYALTANDIGKKIAVAVRLTDDHGYSAKLESDPFPETGTILSLPPLAPVVETLVGNLGQANDTTYHLTATDFAQPFTTGPLGYTLSSVEIQFVSAGSSHTLIVEIWTRRSNGLPNTSIKRLTNPASVTPGSHYSTFTAANGLDLGASTTYLLVVREGGSTLSVQGTDSNGEDAGSSVGWSIGDTSLQRNRFPAGSPWESLNAAMKIRVNGTAKNAGATGRPAISGIPQVGATVSASTTNIMDDNGLNMVPYGYQWIRVDTGGTSNETDIAGANSATYMPVAADAGKKLKVKVSFRDDDGYEEERTSNPWPGSRTILAAPRACPADANWCTTLTVGRRSGANAALGYFEADGIGALDDTTIEYAGNRYRISQVRLWPDSTNEKFRILIDTFVVRQSVFTLGAEEFVTDAGSERNTTPRRYVWDLPAGMAWIPGQKVTMSVAIANSPATGKPAISGTAQVGNTLTASTDDISDADGPAQPVYSYQWVRVDGANEATIPGANTNTYTLAAGDEGKRVKVRVSFADGFGVNENVTSDPYPANGTVASAEAPSPASGHAVSADGTNIVLLFDKDLGATVPATSAFTVTVDGAGAAVQGISLQVDGENEKVHLTMAGTILRGQTVTVGYTAPSPEGAALQDPDGNHAASFSDLAVSNRSTVVTEVSIAAAAASAVYREDGATFTLTRTHSGSALAVAVTLAQTRSFLPAQELSHTVTFAPGATEATLAIPYQAFRAIPQGEEVESGSLTATPEAAMSHTVDATAGSATVNVVVAATVSFDMDTYTVGETDGSLSFEVVMRTGTGAGVPAQAVHYSVSTEEDTATVPDDYGALSRSVSFAPADFTADGMRFRAAKTLEIDIHDDSSGEGDKRFHVVLEQSPGLPAKYWNPVTATGTSCIATRCRTPITIRDDESESVPATGKPSISGTPRVGDMLSVSTRDIRDANGLSAAEFSYQWIRLDGDGVSNPREVVGANAATYTPVAEDTHKKLKVKVSFTDDGGFAEELASDAWPRNGTIAGLARTGTVKLTGVRLGSMEPYKRDAAVDICWERESAVPTGSDVTIEARVRPFWDYPEPFDDWREVARGDGFTACGDGNTGVQWTRDRRFKGQSFTVEMRIRRGEEVLAISPQFKAQAPNRNDAGLDATLSAPLDDEGYGIDEPDGPFVLELYFTDPIMHLLMLETVMGLEAADFEPTNATVAVETWNVGTYKVTVTPTTLGQPVSVHLPAGKVLGVGEDLTEDGANTYVRPNRASNVVTTDTVHTNTNNQSGAQPLAARFETPPVSHDGETPFTLRIAFSEAVTIEPAAMRDHALLVSDGTVTGAARVDGQSDLWELTVEPAGPADIGIIVPLGRACTEPGALCTADGRSLSGAVPAQLIRYAAPGPRTPQGPANPSTLTASFEDVPGEHDGSSAFTLRLAFSEAVFDGSEAFAKNQAIRNALQVSGGTAMGGRRVDPGAYDRWIVRIRPSGNGAVTVSLPATTGGCGTAGAICTPDGTGLAKGASATIQGPPALSVADAEVAEGPGARLEFTIALSRASASTVTVRAATSDGSATAGDDYEAKSEAKTFAPGQTSKVFRVTVLDDDHDEDRETMTVTLSSPSGGNAYIADGTAIGTITNDDPMPQAWLARFGRAVADQVIDAVEGRMGAARAPGTEVNVAGQRVDAAGAPEDDPEAREAEAGLDRLTEWLRGAGGEEETSALTSRAVSGRELLSGSSFALTAGTAESGFGALWGRGAVSRFDGREGDLTLDGEVASALLGADFTRGRGTAGLVVAHSLGEGGYRSPNGGGEVETTLTGLYPWGRYAASERLSLWGLAGYGAGTLTLTPGGQAPIETDMDLAMAALGGRGVLAEAPAEGGPELGVTSDATFVRTTSDVVRGTRDNLAASEGDVTRLRLGLEGTWRGLGTAGGATFVPTLEIGVRHDGGDAETGFGADTGARLVWADPSLGMRVELAARSLLTHEDGSFRDRGFSGSLAWDPRPGTDRGPKLTLRHAVGAEATGGMDALLRPDTVRALAEANDDGPDRHTLEARLDYGIALFGGSWTGVPELGFGLTETGREYIHAWRLVEARSAGLVFGLDVEGCETSGWTGMRRPSTGSASGSAGSSRARGARIWTSGSRPRGGCRPTTTPRAASGSGSRPGGRRRGYAAARTSGCSRRATRYVDARIRDEVS